MMTRAQFQKAQRTVPRIAAPVAFAWFFLSILVFIAVSSRFINWNDKSEQNQLPMLDAAMTFWFDVVAHSRGE